MPKKDNIDAIRRVVGLSGDRIQMFEDALYINGAPVKRERISITAAGPSGPVEIRFQTCPTSQKKREALAVKKRCRTV